MPQLPPPPPESPPPLPPPSFPPLGPPTPPDTSVNALDAEGSNISVGEDGTSIIIYAGAAAGGVLLCLIVAAVLFMRTFARARASNELRMTTSQGDSSQGGSSRRGSLEKFFFSTSRRTSIARKSDMAEARRTSLVAECGISIERDTSPIKLEAKPTVRRGTGEGQVMAPMVMGEGSKDSKGSLKTTKLDGNLFDQEQPPSAGSERSQGGPLSAPLPASLKAAASRGSLKTTKLDGNFFDHEQPPSAGSERSLDSPRSAHGSPPGLKTASSLGNLKAVLHAVDHAAHSAGYAHGDSGHRPRAVSSLDFLGVGRNRRTTCANSAGEVDDESHPQAQQAIMMLRHGSTQEL